MSPLALSPKCTQVQLYLQFSLDIPRNDEQRGIDVNGPKKIHKNLANAMEPRSQPLSLPPRAEPPGLKPSELTSESSFLVASISIFLFKKKEYILQRITSVLECFLYCNTSSVWKICMYIKVFPSALDLKSISHSLIYMFFRQCRLDSTLRRSPSQ